MGKGRSKEPEFVERQAAAANARKAMLERFLAKAAGPEAAPRKEERTAQAVDPAKPAKKKAAPDTHSAARKAKEKSSAKKGKR